MKIIRDIDSLSIKNSIVTIGKFDGLHRGHDKLISVAKSLKGENDSIVIIALDLGNQEILTVDEKKSVLETYGVDYLAEIPLDVVRELSPEAFISEILIDKLDTKCIVVGDDFRFGYGRSGDTETLKEYGQDKGFTVYVQERIMDDEDYISSSRIRTLLDEGNVKEANRLMGHEFLFSGTVTPGKQLGRTIGFPTVNLYPDEKKYVPLYGVYESRVVTKYGEYRGITNIGIRPTVDDSQKLSVETYILDFEKDLYGDIIYVYLKDFIRAEKKFSDVQELMEQIKADIMSIN